ncbi:helix-hairpin-helix domain-containing protein [Candidatus Absconditicoccus praedator]|uniref:helix-hairpin-helix domain-containing protein n=1 Tax=Candidatus Absconditicoccus praedator TaxID=2735562 RepID=UPI001E563FFC|nr:helix-hairpin-helix domain-containing protein [Candidatus Absconditicoccus praedator]UFX82875.1 helix-hairpin-helix domain-containing protein [Candidatus Absconditicoccus praedator]
MLKFIISFGVLFVGSFGIALSLSSIDLNNSSTEDLEYLTGVGPATAENIKNQRPFCKKKQLEEVDGIGPARYDDNKDIIKISPPDEEDLFEKFCESCGGDFDNIDDVCDSKEKKDEKKDDKEEDKKEEDEEDEEENKKKDKGDDEKGDKDEKSEKDGKDETEDESKNEEDKKDKDNENGDKDEQSQQKSKKQEKIDKLENKLNDYKSQKKYKSNQNQKLNDKIDNLEKKLSNQSSKNHPMFTGNLKISEIHLDSDTFPNYIQIGSYGGAYSGSVSIKGLGRGQSERQFDLQIGSGQQKIISYYDTGFNDLPNLKTIDDEVYLTNNGQTLKLFDQDGDKHDKITYGSFESDYSAYFGGSYSGDYRIFDKIDKPTPGFSPKALDFYFAKEDDNKCNFQIHPDKNIFTGSVSYEFDFDATDFEIKYRIEDNQGEKVRSPNYTNNNTPRNFTPSDDYPQIFVIYAKLITDNCETMASQKIGYIPESKYKKNFYKLKENLKNQDYIVEDDMSFRVARSDYTFGQLYDKVDTQLSEKGLSLTFTTGKINGRENIKKSTSSDNESHTTNQSESKTKNSPTPININTASKKKLESLPGVGSATASKIIENRKFCSKNQLKSVPGVGEVTYQNIKPKIFIKEGISCNKEKDNKDNKNTRDNKEKSSDESSNHSPSNSSDPVEINTASITGLQKIDGIGKNHAQTIKQNTPYCNYHDLLKLDGIGETTIENMKADSNVFLESPQKCFKSESKNETTPTQSIEINSASFTGLQKIDGVGEVAANSILEKRPICSKDQLLKIDLIGEKLIEKILKNDNIHIDLLECKQFKNEKDSKNQKRSKDIVTNGTLKIQEIYPYDDLLNSYVLIRSVGGDYNGPLEIKGAGRGSSSRKFDIQLGSGHQKIISSSDYGFPNQLDVKTLEDSLYLTNDGQKLKLIGQNGQKMDKVDYQPPESASAVIYGGDLNNGYRVFDQQDSFFGGEYSLPENIKNAVQTQKQFDEKLSSENQKYQRARKYWSKCVSDRDHYENKMRLYRNYVNLVNQELKYERYPVFAESKISDYYDIYKNSKDAINSGQQRIEIFDAEIIAYDISNIYNVTQANLFDLPQRYQEYASDIIKNKYITLPQKNILSILEQFQNKKQFILKNINLDESSFDVILWIQEFLRGVDFDKPTQLSSEKL